MDKHKWFMALMFLIQAGLASASFFLPAANAFINRTPQSELIVGLLALETTIIGSGLAWLHISESESRRSFEERLLDNIRHIPLVRWLSVNDFYIRFQSELSSCRSRMNIAFFGPIPPTDDPSRHVRHYYSIAIETMKRRKEEPVYFRRIVRLTKANWPWIRELCDELTGIRVASVAVLEDSGDQLRNTLAISVQTVDGERTYLTALSEREDYTPERDLLIESSVVCRGFEVDHDRLWSRATVLLNEGRIQQRNVESIEAKFASEVS